VLPDAIGALEHPAPVWLCREQHPDWLAQRASQMGNRCVDGNHQVEVLDERRYVGEMLKLRACRMNRPVLRDCGEFGLRRSLLYGEPRISRDFGQWLQRIQA